LGTKQIHVEIDEYVWTQFQALYPRQGRKVIEDTLRSMINLKLDVADEEIERLRSQAEQDKKKMDELAESILLINSKISAWEAKKREELIAQRKAEEEREEAAIAMSDSIAAAGFVEDIDFV